MKTYVTPKELRLVGKAYEVRRHLRMLLERTSNPHEALGVRLAQLAGLNTAIGASLPAGSRSHACRIFPFPTR